MKINDALLGIEMNIISHSQSVENKTNLIMEYVNISAKFNENFPRWLLNTAKLNDNTEFVMGFLLALKLVSEQEQINQEDELERIFSLK